MKSKKLLFSANLLFIGMALYLTLSSNSGGITGVSTVGCSGGTCHGSSSSSTTITLSGIPNTGYVPGTTYTVVLMVSNSSKPRAGFDLGCSDGTISNAPAGTALAGNQELRHTTPAQALSGNTSWSFSWTAPTAPSTVFFDVAANAVDFTGTSANDAWNTNSFTFNPASTTAAPSLSGVAASAITSTGATVSASATANGAATTLLVQYGTTASYGSTATPTPNNIGASAVGTSTVATLSGLSANTIYHYRFRAINSVDTTFSTNMIFTTLGPTSVNDLSAEPLLVFPNPTSEYVMINSNHNIQEANVHAYSMNGQYQKLNMEQLSTRSFKVSTKHLAAGQYVFVLYIDGQAHKYSIIKQ